MGAHTSASAIVKAAPEVLFGMVTDIARMGEWSPACVSGQWEGDAGPSEGAWFVGKNRMGDFEYETRNEVVVFDPPRRFAWVAGGVESGWAKWTWEFVATDDGTQVTESWELVGSSPAVEALGVEKATQRTTKNIEETLQRFKAVAEAG